jgi:uncharacterized protein
MRQFRCFIVVVHEDLHFAGQGRTSGGMLKSAAALSLDSVRAAKGPPPVHLWNPPDCGKIDMVIRHDGTWFHEGSPIGRIALVKLFASILRKDGPLFRLVTPVEMVEIAVEDAPFIGVELDVVAVEGAQALQIRTQLDDIVVCGPAHPLRFVKDEQGGYRPYVDIRRGLEARLNRVVHGQLMALGEIEGDVFGVRSCGQFFPIALASELGEP